jgi:hypothetical protein
MRAIASKGLKGLPPAACAEVAGYLIDASLSTGHRLDLRLLVNSLGNRLQWRQAVLLGNVDADPHSPDLLGGGPLCRKYL